MDDAVFVRALERVRQLNRERARLVHRQRAAGGALAIAFRFATRSLTCP